MTPAAGLAARVGAASRGRLIRFALAAVVVAGAWSAGSALLPAGLPAGIVLLGVVFGALDALTAIGLVLVYRAARFVNFAQADIGGLATAVAVVMVTGEHLPYFAALPVGLATGVATGALIDATVVRRFFKAPRLILTVASIGVAQLLGAGELGLPTLFGNLSPLSTFTTPFRFHFDVGPVLFDGNSVAVFVVVPVVLAGLWWFLARTDTGVAVRAAADSDERARLLGVPVRRLSRATWMVAGGLSAVAAMLSAPILGPNLGSLAGPPALLVPLAAAVVGGLDSLAATAAAAIGIDVFQQAVLWSYPRSSTVDVAVFGIVLLAVLARRKTLGRGETPGLGTLTTARDRPLPSALRRLAPLTAARVAGMAALVAVAALVPVSLSAARDTLLAAIAVYAIVAVSMVVLTGWAGQLSLGQFAFVGIGASVTGALLVHAGADLFVALVAAAAAGGAGALLLGLPSLRVPGLFLGVVTLAFAVPVSTWLLDNTYFPLLTPPLVPSPDLLGRIPLSSPLALYELCLAVLAVSLLVCRAFRYSRAGRALLAVRDNDRAAASFGVSPARTKLVAFVLSGMLAGVAGGLYTLVLRGVPFSGFNPEESVVVFTMVVVGGLGSLPGALLGAAYVEGAQYFLGGAAQLLATGAGLLVLLMVLPGGLGELLGRARDRVLLLVARRAGLDVEVLERKAGTADDSPPSSHFTVAEVDGEPATGGTQLACSGIDAAYGDVQVLFGLDLAVGSGQVLALLGTNGSGKSTLLKVISGILPARAGRVVLGGTDVTGWTAEARAAAGLSMVPGGRGVFRSLSVEENLKVGTWLVRRDKAEVARRVGEVLAMFPPLVNRRAVAAGDLSGGEQQMLALGLALLTHPAVLLIDELSLGLAPAVVAELLQAVRTLAEQGKTVVIVEQSINVAASLAPSAMFLERGRNRFRGPTGELASRPDLARAVFLGGNDMQSNGQAAGAGTPKGDARTTSANGSSPSRARRNQGRPAGAVDDERSALRLDDVSVRFGGIAALSHVSLSVHPGEILGVIGANGAGKTTLFDVFSGFVAPSGGRVHLGEVDVTDASPFARARLGLGRMFQDARLFPGLTVAETITAAYERHLWVREPVAVTFRLGDARLSEQVAAEVAERLMAELGLDSYRDFFTAELSTGTRRVVELACAMAHSPAVLLADEPSSGLAQREVESLGGRLRDLRDSTGAALVVIEHDIPMLASIADRIVCMHLGEVLAEGDPEEVLSDDRVIASYLGNDPAALKRSGRVASKPARRRRTPAARGT
ncbi:MAG TPA: ATP-binding cassette domain-containing protein [Acidimicrobiales bacterium]|nr:ATP-binding cassette domain-containing protein [Acidimicrobiales bacterium]